MTYIFLKHLGRGRIRLFVRGEHYLTVIEEKANKDRYNWYPISDDVLKCLKLEELEKLGKATVENILDKISLDSV